MHEDLGHPKTEYAFWEVLIWCHNLVISSTFCIESDQMSGMNHKHSIKSPDRPNILVKCYTTKQKDCNKLENLDLSYFNINLPSLNQQIKVEMHKF